MAFEKVFGPLTVQERIDEAAAVAAWGAMAAMGWKGTPDKLKMQWDHVAPGERPDQDPEVMIGFMRKLQKRSRKGRKRGAKRTPDPRQSEG